MNKSSEHIKNVADTLEKRYGVRVPAKSPIIFSRIEATNLKLYGVKNCWNQPYVIEKQKSKESIEKRLNSLSSHNIEHYGVPWYVQSDEFKEKAKIVNGSSKEEKELIEWLKNIIDEEIVVGSYTVIQPKQLDIYIPSKKIAIEFNGTYYHSIEHGNPLDYHLNKTKMCEEKGIKLIHIWEDEWYGKKEDIKKFILDMINDSIDFKNNLIHENEECFYVDRSKFNRCTIPDSYEIIGETTPEIVLRAKTEKDKYRVPDCGKLILKIKENH